jgi:hypothetical protein
MNTIGIDMYIKHASRMKRRLKALATTAGVDGPFQYWQDMNLCQVHVTTLMTEQELDDWLYRTDHRCEYIGTFTVPWPLSIKDV